MSYWKMLVPDVVKNEVNPENNESWSFPHESKGSDCNGKTSITF